MSENTEKQTEKKSPKNKKNMPSTIAVVVAFAAIFLILGFLIMTKDQRAELADQAAETELENKVDVVDADDKEEMEDEDADVMHDEDEDVLGDEDEATEEEVVVYYPDLYIHEYTLSEENPTEGEEIDIHIEIKNQGDADAEEFHWEWWTDTNELGCEGDIDRLDIGEKETVECEYTYDDYGNFETRVVIDSEDVIDESDEYNNTEEKDVDVLEEQYVDLTITEYSFTDTPKKLVDFTVKIGITNEGNIPAEDFYWEWWGTYFQDDCREHIDVIAPNSTKVVSCDYKYLGWGNAYETKAVVDADDTIEELNEDNNEYQEVLSVPQF